MNAKLNKAKLNASKAADVMKALPPAELESLNKEELDQAEKDFSEFQSLHNDGRCFTCKKPLKTLSSNSPCIHWLLNPNGFKKKMLLEITKQFSFFQIDPYLRWFANIEKPLRNINDLKFDETTNKIIETTIRYKHLEWSFSCTEQDLQGHENAAYANFPHYHFQMRINKKPFINYNDFHIPFSDFDLWKLTLIREHSDTVKHTYLYGEGISAVLKDEFAKEIVDKSARAENPEEADFHMTTMIRAEPGQTISGDQIADLFQESKKTGVSFAKLAQERIGNASVRTIVSEGDGVVDKAQRKKTRGNKDK